MLGFSAAAPARVASTVSGMMTMISSHLAVL